MSESDNKPRPRILFMDDEADIRRVGGKVLKYLGYEAVEVTKGEEAIAAYTEALNSDRPFVAAILDLQIKGGMDGIATMEKLRELDPDVKGILSSGLPKDTADPSIASYGFAGTINKPYEIAALSAVLKDILGPA
ncbi:response regulator [Actomonas aquatica]|uniref:Response regulator n=1 Tax=Actomonas aquatica TaxID=2866162 RepID=A0ABZ1CDY4_9BACT|nr:response regulator [Opitutus sp. WL0086]WRQ89438.1 response regulator [Opitutus sp. WL0086]